MSFPSGEECTRIALPRVGVGLGSRKPELTALSQGWAEVAAAAAAMSKTRAR